MTARLGALKQLNEIATAKAKERAELFALFAADRPRRSHISIARLFRAQFGMAPNHKATARIVREVRKKAKRKGPFAGGRGGSVRRQSKSVDAAKLLTRAVVALESIARSLNSGWSIRGQP